MTKKNNKKKTCFIVAEVAQAHDGSIGILHSYINALAETGVDAIKFQTHIAEAESSQHEPFRVNFSFEDKTRYDYWKRMEFDLQQWKEIKKRCDEVKIEFMSSPFSLAAVDLLEEVGVNRYKIGSGEVGNYLMLEKIVKTGKPVIVSSGMSSYSELDSAIGFLKKHNSDISVLQCTTQYPTPADKVGLNVIPELISRYNIPVGLSDHSGTIYPSLAAVALGATIIEVHATFDRRMFGPDATSSLTINEIKQLFEGIRFIETSLRNPVDKSDNSKFTDLKTIFGKSLAINKDLPKGHILVFEDLEGKKPVGHGIPPTNYKDVIGRKLVRNLKKYSFLKEEDIQ